MTTLYHQVWIDAPAAKVYSAIATADGLTVLDFRHSGWDENSEFLGFCNFAGGETLLRLKQSCESR